MGGWRLAVNSLEEEPQQDAAPKWTRCVLALGAPKASRYKALGVLVYCIPKTVVRIGSLT